MLAIVMGDLVVRSLRWRILLSYAAPHARAPRLFQLETIGLAINNVMFLRLGEIVRACLAARELGISLLTALASIIVERMTDTMALAFLFGAAAQFFPELVPTAIGRMGLMAAGAVVAALVILALVEGYLNGSASEGFLGKYPRALELLGSAALGTRALHSWTAVVQVGALSFLLWTLDAGLYWSGARAVGFQPNLGYGQSVMVLSSAAASSFLPAVPGSFGAFEQAVKYVMVRFGFDAAAALGYAGFVHLVAYLAVTLLGIVFLYRAGHSLASLRALRPS
jgi:uncharacterized membrane protein YbhN (UPF0104 family)